MLADGELDHLIEQAGETHVIPPRENQALLDKLGDPRVLERARQLLDSKDKQSRNRAILCIERIGYVRRDQETAELLLEHAAKTKDKYEVMTTLDALRRCTPPQPLRAAPLVELAGRKEWQVWLPAVECMHLAPPDEVESALLDHLNASPEALVSVANELRYMTSARSIQTLEQLLEHKSLNVRCVALDSLAERLGQRVIPYARRLTSGSFDEQWWAEKWIARYGDATDVSFMAKRARALLTRARKRQCEPPELGYVFPFLSSHSEIPQARRALKLIAQRADRLPENERRWLEGQDHDQG